MATKKITPAHRANERLREVPAPREPESNRRRKWLIGAVVIALSIAIFHTMKLKHVSVPPELIGTWKTTNPNYHDRELDIAGESVSFSTGAGTEYTGFIDHVDSEPDKNGSFYTIYYIVDGTRTDVTLLQQLCWWGTAIQESAQRHRLRDQEYPATSNDPIPGSVSPQRLPPRQTTAGQRISSVTN